MLPSSLKNNMWILDLLKKSTHTNPFHALLLMLSQLELNSIKIEQDIQKIQTSDKIVAFSDIVPRVTRNSLLDQIIYVFYLEEKSLDLHPIDMILLDMLPIMGNGVLFLM